MGSRENVIDFKICFENVDQALELYISKDRKNIIIFMCINDMSQTLLSEKLGYNRSTISRNLNTNLNTGNTFKKRFCEVFGFDKAELNYNPIIFYYICCERKRKELLNQGLQCGLLFDIELLKEYRFTKIASKEMVGECFLHIRKNKESFTGDKYTQDDQTNVDSSQTEHPIKEVENKTYEIEKRLLSDFEVVQISSKTKKKITKKDGFVLLPIICAFYFILIATYSVILSFNEANPEYALYLLITVPGCILLIKLLGNSKIKRYASEFSIFRYEREKDYDSKILDILSIIQSILAIIFLIISIIAAITNKLPEDYEWMKVLYFTLFTPSLLASLLSIYGCTTFKKQLNFKVRFSDILRSIGFYVNFAVTILFIVCVIVEINGAIVLFLQVPLLILSLLIYIIGKINLSKYKLYEYILDTKILIEQ